MIVIKKSDIIGEFITELQFILEDNIYDLDSGIKSDIKAEAHEVLYKVLEKYGVLDD
jgi:hypothetical protein